MVRFSLYTPVSSAVHSMHLDAIEGYARQSDKDVCVSRLRPGWGGVVDILGAGVPDGRILIQSSGLWSLPFFMAAKLRSAQTMHYLHEPTGLWQKISRGNALYRAVVWQLVQHFETLFSDITMVSSERLRSQFRNIFGANHRVEVVPLLFPPPLMSPRDGGHQRQRVTYLGRLDRRRHLDQFVEISGSLTRHGMLPTILTGDHVAAGRRRRWPANIEVIAEANFDERLKATILEETAWVWNPKWHPFSQSGVTIDALRYGCGLVLADTDPEFGRLVRSGIAIDIAQVQSNKVAALLSPPSAAARRQAQRIFSQEHGLDAYLSCLRPLIRDS